MLDQQTVPDACKSVTVAATPEQCFEMFTERTFTWWPAAHILVGGERAGMAFEPGVGGRYYEWDVTGEQRVWGTILAWEPGRHLAMTWRIGGSFQPLADDEKASEIEVTFTPVGPAQTRVDLAHVKLGNVGDGAERLSGALNSPGPGLTLEHFAQAF